jgi:plastocyanin
MRGTSAALFAALAGAGVACGGGGSSTPAAAAPPGGFVITISSSSFSPLDLHVPPGGTVTVVNRDGMSHSVTSEASANAFTPGSAGGVAFDTGQFTSGSRSFTIPSNAANGTRVPYFCTSHLGTMSTPNGTITVDSAVQPSSGGGGGGGGGGGY